MHFLYLRDPLFLACLAAYLVNRFVVKPAVASGFAHEHFNDLICVPFWLPLGVWTGLVSQFIPTVGTYLAIALPTLVALAKQPIDALWVIVFATAYQQVENYLLAPRITSQTVQIHPAVAFGSVIAAGLPLAVALMGLGVGTAGGIYYLHNNVLTLAISDPSFGFYQSAVMSPNGQKLAWVRATKLREYPMPPADLPLIPHLEDLL